LWICLFSTKLVRRKKNDKIQLFDANKDCRDSVDGKPSDQPETETVRGLGSKKNAVFNALIEKEGVKVFDSRQEIKKFRR
jgi:hypothetical protein